MVESGLGDVELFFQQMMLQDIEFTLKIQHHQLPLLKLLDIFLTLISLV